MKTPFQAALLYFLNKKGWGARSYVARKIGKSQQFVSLIADGKSDGKEDTRRDIAEACGYTYEDFLALGRCLLESKSPEPEEPPPAHIPKLRRVSDRTGEGNTREGIISLFDDRETARQIILQLVKIEKTDREYFVAARSYIQGIFDSLDIKKEA